MAARARVPVGGAHVDRPWLYNTCYDILGVLIARVAGRPLPEFLAERLFEPLGMLDTGYEVPAGKLGRFTSYHQAKPSGELQLVDGPDEQWSTPPAFASGAGGLVSTVDDWHAFARVLIGKGTVDDHQMLSPESVRAITTDHLTQAQREAGEAYVVPSTGLVPILLSQLALSGPTAPPVMQDFWRYAAQT